MTRRAIEGWFIAAVLLGIVLVVAFLVSAAPPPDTVRICKTTIIASVYTNSATDPVPRLVRADTTVVRDTIYGVGCPGGRP
jgi:hypothetical protein